MTTRVQTCLICAWRENCAKRFSVSDGGARCPDFSRDVSMRIEQGLNDVADGKESKK